MKKVDTPFNFLFSYAYYTKKFISCLLEEHSKGGINFMVDSGAFSVYNSLKKEIKLENYISFLKDIDPFIEKAVMLDVIGDRDKTVLNYRTMVDTGLRPMFVATMFDNDYDFMKETLNVCSDICVAGGTITKGTWIVKRFLDIYNNTDKKARIHGLGFVVDTMFKVPIVSSDCSTYSSASRYGWFMYWDKTYVKKITYTDILKRKVKLNEDAILSLEEIKVTPDDFFNPLKNRGNKSICKFAAEVAYVKYQIFCKNNNRDLFLAVSNQSYFKDFCWIIRNFNNLSYYKWLEECYEDSSYSNT